MKISIIVPVYNVEQYIKECFDSIAAQTYKGDIECIFVDDCGQDKSVEILEKMIAGYQGGIFSPLFTTIITRVCRERGIQGYGMLLVTTSISLIVMIIFCLRV